MTNRMTKFNKLTIVLIKLICFTSLLLQNVLAEGEDHQMEHILHRVKRKGIGSFFGAKSKTTPNQWDNTQPQRIPPLYGTSGESQFGNVGSGYFQNYENHREANLYYLIVASISFGVIVYCCYQCHSENRNLDDRIFYRTRALRTSDGDQTLNRNDTFFKPIAPTAPTIDNSVNQMNANQFISNRMNNSNEMNDDVPNYSSYADNVPPPSYQEAIEFESRKQHQLNHQLNQ